MRSSTLPSIQYKNHSGDHASHLGGGSTGIGETPELVAEVHEVEGALVAPAHHSNLLVH